MNNTLNPDTVAAATAMIEATLNVDDDELVNMVREHMIDFEPSTYNIDDELAAIRPGDIEDIGDAVLIVMEAARRDDMTAREPLTTWALSLSLCPIHFVDYAICFDDNNIECAQVRTVHPGHDT